MNAPIGRKYLLLRECATLAGVSAKVLRQQVDAGRIPEAYVMRSGLVRPVVRIHRAYFEKHAEAQPVLAGEATIPWSGK